MAWPYRSDIQTTSSGLTQHKRDLQSRGALTLAKVASIIYYLLSYKLQMPKYLQVYLYRHDQTTRTFMSRMDACPWLAHSRFSRANGERIYATHTHTHKACCLEERNSNWQQHKSQCGEKNLNTYLHQTNPQWYHRSCVIWYRLGVWYFHLYYYIVLSRDRFWQLHYCMSCQVCLHCPKT